MHTCSFTVAFVRSNSHVVLLHAENKKKKKDNLEKKKSSVVTIPRARPESSASKFATLIRLRASEPGSVWTMDKWDSSLHDGHVRPRRA